MCYHQVTIVKNLAISRQNLFLIWNGRTKVVSQIYSLYQAVERKREYWVRHRMIWKTWVGTVTADHPWKPWKPYRPYSVQVELQPQLEFSLHRVRLAMLLSTKQTLFFLYEVIVVNIFVHTCLGIEWNLVPVLHYLILETIEPCARGALLSQNVYSVRVENSLTVACIRYIFFCSQTVIVLSWVAYSHKFFRTFGSIFFYVDSRCWYCEIFDRLCLATMISHIVLLSSAV